MARATTLQALQRDRCAGVARVLGVGPGRLRRLVGRVVPLHDPTWPTRVEDMVLRLDEPRFREADLLIHVAVQHPE